MRRPAAESESAHADLRKLDGMLRSVLMQDVCVVENKLHAVYPMWFSTPASDPQNAPEEVALRDALRPLPVSQLVVFLASIVYVCWRCSRCVHLLAARRGHVRHTCVDVQHAKFNLQQVFPAWLSSSANAACKNRQAAVTVSSCLQCGTAFVRRSETRCFVLKHWQCRSCDLAAGPGHARKVDCAIGSVCAGVGLAKS